MDLVKKKDMKEIINYDLTDKFMMENYENRFLFLNNEIDETIVNDIVYYVFRYNQEDIGIPVDERKPITVFINSPGGSVFDGYSAIDAITQSITPVYTVNIGLCASMGYLIYLAGHKRFTMPHSTFLMHEGSCMDFGATSKVKDRIEFEAGELEQVTRKYVLDRTNIKPDFYEKKYRVEFYFLPQKAKELGVAHYIIGDDCTISDVLNGDAKVMF